MLGIAMLVTVMFSKHATMGWHYRSCKGDGDYSAKDSKHASILTIG